MELPHTPDARTDRRTFKPNGQTHGVNIQLREHDIETTAGLHWVAKLFRVMAGLLVLLMVTQLILGLTSAIEISYGVLVAEALRLTIFAGLLWGAGDLADLFVQSHHDLRAARILLGRLTHLAEKRDDGDATH